MRGDGGVLTSSQKGAAQETVIGLEYLDRKI